MSCFDFDNKRIFYTKDGEGRPLLLLHGNTASAKMFDPIVSLFENRTVIRMDFLGCGRSDRLDSWPLDLWYDWGEQAAALLTKLGLSQVDVLGCSGGALAALNLSLEHPDLVHSVAADSFEGLEADASLTEQICRGRSCAKELEDFRSLLRAMHGDDWEQVLAADTVAVVSHAEKIGSFCHRPLRELQPKLLLTGSREDEMFEPGHYESLFDRLSASVKSCCVHIFNSGGHPALLSNSSEYIRIFEEFAV